MIPFALLFIVGAIVGAFVNWAIYSWAMFQRRNISPWMKPTEDEVEPAAIERIPIYGWLKRKGKKNGRSVSAGKSSKQTLEQKYGSYFWVRPFLLEIVWAVGLPLFYFWQMGGGLTGGVIPAVAGTLTWFCAHSILIALMCIGTFIDFDEKTIPDQVTITGTLIALLFAAFAPWFRLPEVVASLAGKTVRPVHHASPLDLDLVAGTQVGQTGFWIAILVFAIWIWSLLPKLPAMYVGFKKSMRFIYAHAMQPKRKTKCAIRVKKRKTPALTILLGSLFVIGMALIPAAWLYLPVANWQSLYGSIVGMAIGGGVIWAIRIVGTYTLRQEAMGFGDVTLMVMVGAFLGWQATLLACFFAPFLALIIALVQYLITRNKAIAFGPYLCAGTLFTLLVWSVLWSPDSRAVEFFRMGPMLFVVFGFAMVLMGLMLLYMAWRKGMFDPEEQVEQGATE